MLDRLKEMIDSVCRDERDGAVRLPTVRRIQVDQLAIKQNREDGGDRPVFTVWVFKPGRFDTYQAFRARRVGMTGPSELVYAPNDPLPNGSTVWVETTDTVRIWS